MLASVDSSLVGINIFSLLSQDGINGSGTVVINQSNAVRNAMSRHIAANQNKKINGYRIRIFFDNSQLARINSESIANSFSSAYPGIGVYRGYDNPYFKVTVGDFRTRVDAMQFLQEIKNSYPSGFVVKDEINYPTL